jgi:hypothetical protein
MTTPIDTTRLRAPITDDELRALREMLAEGHPCDITNAMAYNALPALLDEVERLRARPTWERVINLANGSHDYGGGYHGADYEVYQHGISTVCNVMRAASEQGDKPDMQLRVVEAIGAEAITPREPEEGGTR